MKDYILVGNDTTDFVISLTDQDKEVPIIKKETYSTKDFISNLMYSGADLVLPKNCKYFNKFPNLCSLAIIEEEPSIRTIKVDLTFQSAIESMKLSGNLLDPSIEDFIKENPDPPYRFNLSFPYIVYFIYMNPSGRDTDIKVFYRLHPITSIKDYLLVPNLPNINTNCSICLGDDTIRHNSSNNIIDVCNHVIERFWINSFNYDYLDNYFEYSSVRGISNFLDWSYNTKKDPMFIFNIDWKAHSKDIQEEIRSFNHTAPYEDYNISYLSKIVKNSEKCRTKDPKNLKTRYYSDSILLSSAESKFLTVGDELIYNNKNVYVNSIILSGNTRHVELVDNDNKVESIKLDEETVNKFLNQLYSNNCVESIEFNGRTFKINDIVYIELPSGNKRVKQITKIRKNRNETVDLMFSRECYMLNEMTFKYFKPVENIEFSGITLEVGKKYFVISTGDSYSSISTSRVYIYRGVKVNNSSNNISFLFTTEHDEYSSTIVAGTEKNYCIIPCEEILNNKKEVISFSNKIITNSDDYIVFVHNKMLYGLHTKISSTSSYRPYPEFDLEKFKKNILSNDNKVLHIDGQFSNIHFEVGDKVVIATWEQPEKMLHVKEITGFHFDVNNCLYVDTITAYGERDSFLYISSNSDSHRYYVVNIGLIRHIIPEYLGIKCGDKVVAKVSGMPSFPKKDTNIVIGFINDTTNDTPMMYCSNFCTYWAVSKEYLESNFEFISPSEKKYEKLQITDHKENINKIKNQPGDLFYSKNYPYTIICMRYGAGLTRSTCCKADFGLGSYDSVGDHVRGEYKDMIRYGFLTERNKTSDYNYDIDQPTICSTNVLPDLLSWYVKPPAKMYLQIYLNRYIFSKITPPRPVEKVRKPRFKKVITDSNEGKIVKVRSEDFEFDDCE